MMNKFFDYQAHSTSTFPALTNEFVIHQCTGCLITADGSEDEKIKPEGLPNYRVPPPIDYVEPMLTMPGILLQ